MVKGELAFSIAGVHYGKAYDIPIDEPLYAAFHATEPYNSM